MKKLVQFVIISSVVAIPATPALCLTDMGEISCGQTLSGSIDAAAQMDTWTFYGQAGDRVLMALKATSGSLYPYMVWYDPDSNEEVSGYQFLDEVLDQTGTYTVVVYDGSTHYGEPSLDDTGDYSISLTCLAPPPDSPDLVVSSLDVSPNPVPTAATATGSARERSCFEAARRISGWSQSPSLRSNRARAASSGASRSASSNRSTSCLATALSAMAVPGSGTSTSPAVGCCGSSSSGAARIEAARSRAANR